METTYTYYALSIKGGFYSGTGAIVEEIATARLFKTEQQAIEFRKIHDPKHRVDCSTLLTVQMLVSWTEDE